MSIVIQALEGLISYTKSCEGLLNCTEAGQVKIAQAALKQTRLDDALLHINIGAMAEIKATIDGKSTQLVKDIVYGAIAEIEAWKAKEQGEIK
jgi:hypothetical protein